MGRKYRLAAGLLGSIVASIGAVAFLSYFSGAGSAFVQGELTTMSAPADGFRILRLMVLRASPEGDLRTLLDSCSLPTLLFTPDAAFALCNQAATRLLGWNEAQWQGRSVAPDSSGQPRAVTALLPHGQTLVVARPETA